MKEEKKARKGKNGKGGVFEVSQGEKSGQGEGKGTCREDKVREEEGKVAGEGMVSRRKEGCRGR